VFWIGTAVLVVAGVLLATGTRRYFSVQKVLFVLAVGGTAVLVAVMLLGSRNTFKANLHELTGLDYAGVVATAKQNGYVTGSFDFWTSVKFLIWPLLPLLGAVQSIGIGGEVKRVRRSQLLGMLGAVAATGILIAVFDGLAAKAFGYEFQGAIGFNSISGIAEGSTEASVGASPWFTVLAGILTSNVILATVIMATFVAWIWFWIPAELAYTTRSMIAWSFDRIAPDRLGHVSERFHTPVVAIGLSTAGSVVFMWLIAYRNIAFLSLIEALVVVWGAAMVAAVLFPRTRRELFQASPAASSRIGGVPVMVVSALVSLAFFALVLYLLWNDPIAAGPMFTLDHLSREFWIVLGIVVFGVAWFLGTRRYRRRQGIDVDLAFRQIPIE
jgi:amino acid transporter